MRQKVRYDVLDPTGNITILVETPVDRRLQPAVAAKLMALEPTAEQTGFVSGMEPGSVVLRMAGGEFCGNAAMSAAALCASAYGDENSEVAVRFDGTDVAVQVTAGAPSADGARRCAVAMPAPTEIRDTALPGGGTLPVVFFPGIAHVICEADMPAGDAERLCREWCRYLSCEALGIMRFDRKESRLTPLVYVEDGGTLFWENSCASGTAALGYWLARESGRDVDLRVSEPGGTLGIETRGGSLILTGSVRMTKTAETEIEP